MQEEETRFNISVNYSEKISIILVFAIIHGIF